MHVHYGCFQVLKVPRIAYNRLEIMAKSIDFELKSSSGLQAAVESIAKQAIADSLRL